MKFEPDWADLNAFGKEKSDALIIPVPLAYVPVKSAIKASAIETLLAQAIKNKHFSGANDQILNLYSPSGIRAPYVVFVGCGEAEPMQVKNALTHAVAEMKDKGLKTLSIALHALASRSDLPRILYGSVLGVASAVYTYIYTKPSASPSSAQIVRFTLPKKASLPPEWTQALAVAKGQNLAREWGNRPANHATPGALAQAARDLTKRHARLSCKILEHKDIERLGMGAFLSVAQGSDRSPKFIVLQYTGARKSQAPVALVGKGITFDTGGISIKPAPGMDEMKFDMCGAASVLGAFEALGELQPKLNVLGLIPTCENMPSGRATRPGDVVTSMSGQTIEVLNTDAEGRLILCDALEYARQFKPRAVIDIATLTGACVIALGHVRAGLFSNNDALAEALSIAGEAALDPCWRMPLDEAYAQELKSNFADMANVGSRAGGSITAAKFLQKYTSDMQWAHLDIAGVGFHSGKNKGATGRPVPLLLSYLLAQVAQAAK